MVLRGSPDTKSRLRWTRRRFRMSLARWRLCHGRRSGDADPAIEAVDGSDPPSRHASIGIGQDGDVHPHPPVRCGSLPASSPSRKGVERRVGAAEDPFADLLDVGLVGVAAQGRDAAVPGLGRLPARDRWPVATSRGGWHGVSMPILPRGTPGAQSGGSLRSRPKAPARHGRVCGHAATERRAATCGIMGVSAEGTLSCPPASNVGRTPALRPRRQGSGPGNSFRATHWR